MSTHSDLKSRIGQNPEQATAPEEGDQSALRNRVSSASETGNARLSALRDRIGKNTDQEAPADESASRRPGLITTAVTAVRDRLARTRDTEAGAPAADSSPAQASGKPTAVEGGSGDGERGVVYSVPSPTGERAVSGPAPLSAARSPTKSLLAGVTGAVRRHASGRRPWVPRFPWFSGWSKPPESLQRPDWLRRKEPKLNCGPVQRHAPLPSDKPAAAEETVGRPQPTTTHPPGESDGQRQPDNAGDQARPVETAALDRTQRLIIPADTGLNLVLRPWRALGWGIIAFFIVGSGVWAANTRLDAAAIAHGTVAVETSRKTIQHLEGGIIKEISVSEGDRVEAGQILIKFDDTYTQGNLDMLNGRHVAALALRARLVAERDGAKEIEFPDELLKRPDDPKVAEVITGEIDIFKSRDSRIRNQESILRQRVEKHRREITGLRSQVDAGRRQLGLMEEEIATLDDLFKKGVVSKTRLLAMQRQAAAISGEIGDYMAQIARAGKSINEVKLQLTAPRSKHLNQVTEQLQIVQGEIAGLREKIHAAKDVGRRTSVTAPQAGTVVALQVHTAGGVVQPGQALMDLVPEEDRLVIDVRVNPADIDAVYAGMTARVRLTAYNARTTPMLDGTVTSVSADRVSDSVTGEAYFTARVIPTGDLQAFDLSTLKAGMQAEVFLVTAERTALDYMVEPLVRSFSRAGREQ
jgi:HlyD family type I secretion membrane fusion protein